MGSRRMSGLAYSAGSQLTLTPRTSTQRAHQELARQLIKSGNEQVGGLINDSEDRRCGLAATYPSAKESR